MDIHDAICKFTIRCQNTTLVKSRSGKCKGNFLQFYKCHYHNTSRLGIRHDETITELYVSCYLFACFWSQGSSRCETNQNVKTHTDCLISYFSTKRKCNEHITKLRFRRIMPCTLQLLHKYGCSASYSSKGIRSVKDAYTTNSWLQWRERTDQILELCHVDDHNYWRRKWSSHRSV
jgi:hypothetical protein